MTLKKKKWKTNFNPDDYKRPLKLREDLVNFSNGKTVLKKGSQINLNIAKKLHSDGLKNILVDNDFFRGKYIKNNLVNPNNNEIILKAGGCIEQDSLDEITKQNIKELIIADINPINKGLSLIHI